MTRDELTERVVELFPPLAEVKPWDWGATDEGEPVVMIESARDVHRDRRRRDRLDHLDPEHREDRRLADRPERPLRPDGPDGRPDRGGGGRAGEAQLTARDVAGEYGRSPESAGLDIGVRLDIGSPRV